MLLKKAALFLCLNAMFMWTVFGFAGGAGEPSLDHAVFQSSLQDLGSDADFAAVANQLNLVRILRADFSQEKKIQVLRHPLRSQGRFLFSAKSGLLWQTSKPFDTIFVITPKGISQMSEGEIIVSVRVQDQPVIHGFTQVFMAMFTGDTSILKEKFSLYFQGDPNHWTLGLVPKGRMMASMIHHIVLSGGATVQRVDFVEKNGDKTQLEFTQVRVNGDGLSAGERIYFEER